MTIKLPQPQPDDNELIEPWQAFEAQRCPDDRSSWALHWEDGVRLYVRNTTPDRDIVASMPLPHIRTRGDMRLLLAVLANQEPEDDQQTKEDV